MSTQKCKPPGTAIKKLVFGTQEALPVPRATELASPAPTPAATLIMQTLPTPEAALPVLTPPQPFAPAAEPVPAPSKENSLTHRLQARDSRSNGQG